MTTFDDPDEQSGERGMVSAEFATALPAVVLVLAMALAVLVLVVDEVRCVDAARAGARAASRGDSAVAVRQTASRLAPAGATVELAAAGGSVRVTVSAAPPPIARWVPGLPGPSADAQMPIENAAGDDRGASGPVLR